MLCGATFGLHVLLRILRRLLEMHIGDLKVVLRRHGNAIADPLAKNMDGVRLAQLSFSRRAEILEQLWPRCYNMDHAKKRLPE